MIRFLAHNEIDKNAWDNCIENSKNSLVYACSWYLDIVNPKWWALAESDYSVVMPLPYKKKYGISYLIRPYFTQQLGIFSKHTVNIQIVSEFLKMIASTFKYCNFNLNVNSMIAFKGLEATGITYLLPLQHPYKSIYNEFGSNTKRNLKKANDAGLKVSGLNNHELFFSFYKNHGKFNPGTKFMSVLKELTREIIKRNCGEIKVVYNSKNEILSAVLWIRYKEWIVYLVPCTSRQGKEQGSNFLLIDEIIKENAGSNLTLDFEGSVLPGLARFYEGFGAKPANYPVLRFNRLPFPLNLLKK
jgi:hypothetical protein